MREHEDALVLAITNDAERFGPFQRVEGCVETASRGSRHASRVDRLAADDGVVEDVEVDVVEAGEQISDRLAHRSAGGAMTYQFA